MSNNKLRQEYLVCYDIKDNKKRSLIHRELSRYGLKSVQKSVFWGYLTHAEAQAVKRYLENGLDKSDKGFILRTHCCEKNSQGFFIGHNKEDFKDWQENYVI